MKRIWKSIQTPVIAIITSLVVAAIVIILTAESLAIGVEKVADGYLGILDGAVFNVRGFTNSLTATTPLILTALAVAIPFRAGLFNIGAEGQFMMGALFGTLAGIYFPAIPVIHIIVTLLAGFLGGALWGYIPGILRAKLGAHEVINTIMLNFVAVNLVNFLVRGPLKDPNPSSVQTAAISATAQLPRLFGTRLHLGFFIACLLAVGVYYFLFKTTWGFSLRTTGQNPSAAEYAGIHSKSQFVISMALAGGLAGMAGVIEVQGLTYVLTEGFASGYGFDAIAVSLLVANDPIAIIPSAFIFGILRIGGDFLQIRAGLSVHIVSMFRALILLFAAAPAIVSGMFRQKRDDSATEGAPLTRGWGGQ